MPLRAGTLPSYQKIRRPGSGTGFRPCRRSDFVSALVHRPLGQDLAFWIRFRLIGAQNFPIWDPHTSVGIFGGPSRAWTLHTSDPCASTFHIMGHGYVPYNDAPQNSLSGLVRPSSLQPQSIKAHGSVCIVFQGHLRFTFRYEARYCFCLRPCHCRNQCLSYWQASVLPRSCSVWNPPHSSFRFATWHSE